MTKATKSKGITTPDLLKSIIQKQISFAKEGVKIYLELRESKVALRTQCWANRKKIGFEPYDRLNAFITENDKNVEAIGYIDELIKQILTNPYPRKRVGFFALSYQLMPTIEWDYWRGKVAWGEIFEQYKLPASLIVCFPDKAESVDIVEVERALLEIASGREQFPSKEATSVLAWHQKSVTYKEVKCALEERGWSWRITKVSGRATRMIATPR